VDDNKHHGALFRFKVFHRDGKGASAVGVIEKTTLSRGRFTGVPDASIKPGSQ
jgi:endonuclease-8